MQAVYQTNATYAASARPQNDGWKPPPPVFLLVMGLSRCGKSSFINLMTGQADCSISTGHKLCTRFPRTCRVSRWIGNCEFRFIDTPGFANDTIDDRLVLERLVEYFAPRDNRYDGSAGPPRRVAGLLYIHSEDEPFKGRTSRKTIEMLVRILGVRFLDRVTVLVRSQNGVPNDLAKVVQSEDSPLYPLYCNKIKPWATIPYTQELQPVEHVLQSYIGLSPRLVWLAAVESFVQRYGNNRQHDDIPGHLRELFPEDVGPLIAPEQADAQIRLSEREDELARVHILLAQREEEIKALKSAHENELKDIQEKSMAEKADHDIQRGGLCNTIREQKAEITELQSRNSSGLKEAEALKQSAHENELKNIQKRNMADKSDHGFQHSSLCKTTRDEPQGRQLIPPNESASKSVTDGTVTRKTSCGSSDRALQFSWGVETSVTFNQSDPNHQNRKKMILNPAWTIIPGRWKCFAIKGATPDKNTIIRIPFSLDFPSPSTELGPFELSIYSYSGDDEPVWIKNKQGKPLAKFRKAATIQTSLESLREALEPILVLDGNLQWQLNFDACMQFGDTALEAYLEWQEKGITRAGPRTSIPLFNEA